MYKIRFFIPHFSYGMKLTMKGSQLVFKHLEVTLQGRTVRMLNEIEWPSGSSIEKHIGIWSNYSDLKHDQNPQMVVKSKGNPLISGKPRLVKYNNLPKDGIPWIGNSIGLEFHGSFGWLWLWFIAPSSAGWGLKTTKIPPKKKTPSKKPDLFWGIWMWNPRLDGPRYMSTPRLADSGTFDLFQRLFEFSLQVHHTQVVSRSSIPVGWRWV